MIIATTHEIAGRNHEVLGLVQGNVVQTKHVGRDFMAGFKSIVGGEIRGYTELLIEARTTATERMLEQARAMGADAIVSCRFITCSVMANASEVMAYGTAVRFR